MLNNPYTFTVDHYTLLAQSDNPVYYPVSEILTHLTNTNIIKIEIDISDIYKGKKLSLPNITMKPYTNNFFLVVYKGIHGCLAKEAEWDLCIQIMRALNIFEVNINTFICVPDLKNNTTSIPFPYTLKDTTMWNLYCKPPTVDSPVQIFNNKTETHDHSIFPQLTDEALGWLMAIYAVEPDQQVGLCHKDGTPLKLNRELFAQWS